MLAYAPQRRRSNENWRLLTGSPDTSPEAPDLGLDLRQSDALLKAGALQSAIFNSANFSPAAAPLALMVEHDLKPSELLRLAFEAEGFDVLHADCAEAALGIAAQRRPSLM
jgi:hypothetical protein